MNGGTLLCSCVHSVQLLNWDREYGYYQAGLLGFKQEENSRNILNWWKEKCLEWCFDENDQTWNRWGDQKYLEHIPHLFENIKIIRNIGVNAAPWNLVMIDLYTVCKENEKDDVRRYGASHLPFWEYVTS